MNITRRKARVPIAALSATALITGLGGLSVGAAFGAGTTLGFAPTSTSATIMNTDAGSSSTLAPLAYGVKLTGVSSSDTRPLYVEVLSGPTSGEVLVEKADANDAPAASPAGTQVQDIVPANVTLAAASAGATTITLSGDPVTPTNNIVGKIVKIDSAGTPEWAYVTAYDAGTNVATLASPLRYAHNVGSLLAEVGAPSAANDAFLPVAVHDTNDIERVFDYDAASADNIYLAATDPGTYTLRFFLDTNGDGEYGATLDDTTGTFTLNVKDVTAATSTTTDDLNFNASAPSSAVKGLAVTATSDPGLTVQDVRGTTSGKGILGTGISSLLQISFAGVAGATAAAAATTFSGTTFSRTSGATTATGTLTSQPLIDLATDYAPASQARTTTVSDNGVTAVALDATDVTGTVKETGGAVAVKTGTAAVTYKATVTDGDADKSGNIVYFTLGGADVASLTTDGTTVDATNHVYSAVTDSSGVASLTVTSSVTAAADTYTVSAQTNNVASVPATLTATYADAAAGTIEITSTAAELTPAPGSSAAIKGKLVDQFGAAFQPASSASQQVVVGIDVNASTYVGADVTLNVTLADGVFSGSYTPTTTPTAGQTDSFQAAYGAVTKTGTINWASTTEAASVTLTTPNDAATGINLSDYDTIAPGQATGATDFGSATAEITGTVRDASNALLAFKAVTITGSAGVYFSTATSGATLATSITTVTNASGAIGGVYAFFTKSGTVSITATAGSVSDMATMETDHATDPYVVSVDSVSGTPGETLIVTGLVKDAFGNPASGATVDLSTGTSTIGVLGSTSVTSNTEGVFKTTFLSGSNQSGTATLTATLNGQTANRKAVDAWTDTAGLTIAEGDYEASNTITISELELTLTATGEIEGYADTELSGHYKANSTVDIYAKPHGEDSYNLVDSVSTDSDGNYGTSIRVLKITSWLARAGGLSSDVQTTIVRSKVTLQGKGMGRGVVQLTMNGDPNAERKTTFYMVGKGGKLIPLRTVWTNEKGMARVYITFKKKSAKTFRAYYAYPHTRVGFGELAVNVT